MMGSIATRHEPRRRRPRVRASNAAVAAGCAALLTIASCGGSSDSSSTESTTPVSQPTPAQMCPSGSWPRAAAFDKETGAFEWASCVEEDGLWIVTEVSDEAVYLQLGARGGIATLRPEDGTREAGLPPPAPERREYDGRPVPVEVDGYVVVGGQDDPVNVRAPDGTTWRRDGVFVYDDVIPVGDGAVFASEPGSAPRLVGYELATGDTRWEVEGDVPSPWLVDGQRLYCLWYDLQVRSTVDGTLIWATDYSHGRPSDGHGPPTRYRPRMSGVQVDGDTVYVSFTSEPSGGD